ncbi:MAG: molybdopterin-synthase adenylyltransferase MoeB [Bacteroidota bacterium]
MPEKSFGPEELARYARHFALPEFGLEGQRKLQQASVLVVGAGGLGCPMLQYLAAAGVGRIGIVDFDKVDSSNLQRQVLYSSEDVGRYKAEAAAERIRSLNPHVRVDLHLQALSRDNALDIIEPYDLVADGTDNFPTRYLVNDACVLLGKVNVYASVFRFEGQLSVFNFPYEDGRRGPNYRDLFPEPPPPGLVPNCADGGVLGVLPGIIGSLQASEVIKLLTGVGEPLVGRLFLFDAAAFSTRVLKIQTHSKVEITELIDYDAFCGLSQALADVQQLSVQQLQAWQKSGERFLLIDVREPHEHEMDNMGGELIPLSQIEAAADRLPRDQKIVIHCQTGQRSARAIQRLQHLAAFSNLYNLAGGIQAWRSQQPL